jgi:hypothetical protein
MCAHAGFGLLVQLDRGESQQRRLSACIDQHAPPRVLPYFSFSAHFLWLDNLAPVPCVRAVTDKGCTCSSSCCPSTGVPYNWCYVSENQLSDGYCDKCNPDFENSCPSGSTCQNTAAYGWRTADGSGGGLPLQPFV